MLVYAHREELPGHGAYRDWLTAAVNGEAAYGMSELVLAGFVRVVTNPRVFDGPTPLETALAATEILRAQRTASSSRRDQHTGTSSQDCAFRPR